jgi:hypothetical protein
LASCTSFRNNGEGAHLDNLRSKFFIVNDQLEDIITFISYLSSLFLTFRKKNLQLLRYRSLE